MIYKSIEDLSKHELSMYQNTGVTFNLHGFLMIPYEVADCKELSDSQKMLFARIHRLTQLKGYCWATNGYLSDVVGVAKETISRWISQLEKLGFIKIKMIYEENSKEIKERRIYLPHELPEIKKIIKDYDLKNPENVENNTNDVLIEKSIHVLTEESKGVMTKESIPHDTNVKGNYKNNNNIKDNKINKISEDILGKKSEKQSKQKNTKDKTLLGNNKKISKRVILLGEIKKLIISYVCENFNNNDDLIEYLNLYFENRSKKGLEVEQAKIMLEDLNNFTDDEQEAIQAVRGAYSSGALNLIPEWKLNHKVQNYRKSRADNTAGRKVKSVKDMTEDEKRVYRRDNLAKDEEGNYIRF